MTLERSYKGDEHDIYDFVIRTPMSTQEVTVYYERATGIIEGDTVAYGGWIDVELKECLAFLDILKPEQILTEFIGGNNND